MGKQIQGSTVVEGRGVHRCTADDTEASGVLYSASEYSLDLRRQNLTQLQLMQKRKKLRLRAFKNPVMNWKTLSDMSESH